MKKTQYIEHVVIVFVLTFTIEMCVIRWADFVYIFHMHVNSHSTVAVSYTLMCLVWTVDCSFSQIDTDQRWNNHRTECSGKMCDFLISNAASLTRMRCIFIWTKDAMKRNETEGKPKCKS